MNLGQVVPRRLFLQRQFQVKLLPDGCVHDAAREDVREAAIVTRAPGEQTGRRKNVRRSVGFGGAIHNGLKSRNKAHI